MICEFTSIETNRLLLRKLMHHDWKMISYLRSDALVNQYVKRPSAKTKDEALAFIARINNGIKDGNTFYWAITERDNGSMLGSICLWNFSEDRRVAEVGYDLSPKFQNKGIMSEALKSILDFASQTLKLDLLEAYTHRDNESSKILLERNSFTLVEGKVDGNNDNNIVYSLSLNIESL